MNMPIFSIEILVVSIETYAFAGFLPPFSIFLAKLKRL